MSAAASERRLARLREALDPLEVDQLLVDDAVDRRYLAGFTGSSALLLIAASPEGGQRFLTDFRYTAQSEREVPSSFERMTVTGELYESLPGLLGPGPGRLGYDESKLTVRAHRRLGELLGESWELVPCNGLLGGLRAVKEAEEIERIGAACALADEALKATLEQGLIGRTEREVAFALESRMRELGAQELSFPSIVASAEHGALPHAQPRGETIVRDVLVTVDWGAQLDGYCSDCTRTFATGESISAEAREVYGLVLDAQLQSLAAVKAGPNGRELDAVAREIIEAAGQGANFGHGLGHGVGLEVHESPRLSRNASDDPIVAGNVVSVEPGVYLPGKLGVRIEDLVAVRTDGAEVLTGGIAKELTVIA